MSLKKRLNEGLWPVLILTLICIVCTTLLAFTNDFTAELRGLREQESLNANKKLLFPEAKHFTELQVNIPDAELSEAFISLETAENEGQKLLGYLIRCQAKGYGGYVPFYAAFDSEGTLLSVRALSNGETPGLGQRVSEPDFLAQFAGAKAGQSFGVKSGGDITIDALASATISSKASAAAISAASSILAQYLEGGLN